MSEAQRVILEGLPARVRELTVSTLWEQIRALVPGGAERMGASLQTIAVQLEQIRPLSQQQAAALLENTQAVVRNTAELSGRSSVGGAVAEQAKSAATTLLKGLTLSPLVSGLIGWIKGSRTEEPAPATKYVKPAPVRLEAGLLSSGAEGIARVDYDDRGTPRPVNEARPSFAPPITIQVQALDSRSFLDHSEEIARAVREALLHAHVLGDVIREL